IGPSAVAFGQSEVAETAKALTVYARSAKNPLKIKGGVLGTRLLDASEVSALAVLPPRGVLVAQVVQHMQLPIASLLSVLSANLTGLVGVLQARKQQLEGG
ncbi:MAG: 50S ribosomal protein L10, partial [Chloroflexi bacterium]|nr:50S ribosomal protein L10 [Chloroflexota bacterium]